MRFSVSSRVLLTVACAAGLFLVYQTVSAQSGSTGQAISGGQLVGESRGVAVVELFTSQGCSSCPPADRLLTAIADTARSSELPIYTLSMHVDYWNDLGWSDPYSAKAFTNRQRRYAAATGSSRIYTPQMIVNGSEEFVGSNARLAQAAIRSAVAAPASAKVDLRVAGAGKTEEWTVSYAVAGAAAGDQLVVCLVADASANHVPRGENTGRDLAHSGVVRAIESQPIAASGRGNIAIRWPSSQTRDSASPSVVAFVQDGRSLAIRGAARWSANGG